MHATARTLNIIRMLNAWILTLALTGAPRPVLIGDTRSQVGPGRTIRATLTPIGADYHGRYDATSAAYVTDAFLTFDLFWPTGDATGPADLYEIIGCADEVQSELTRLILPMQDFSTDPSSPTTISGAYLRTIRAPDSRALPAEGGFARRQVLATVSWIAADLDT